MKRILHTPFLVAFAAAAVLAAGAVGATAVTPAGAAGHRPGTRSHHTGHPSGHRSTGRLPGGYKHLVVIYEENHSFDNLYGGWGEVNGHRVDGLDDASVSHETQVAQDGTAYGCLLQDDVNLTSPPLSGRCKDNHDVYSTSGTTTTTTHARGA